MSRKKTIILNTISNIGTQFLSIATGFLILPLVLKYFGKEVYGINAYIESILLIFNFFSLAISMTLMKYVPELIAKKEEDKLNELISSMIPVSALLHFFLGLIIFTFPLYGLDWFNVAPELQNLTKNVMQIVGIFVVIRFPGSIVHGILRGMQYFHLSNKISLISILTYVLAYLYVSQTNSSLVAFVFIMQTGFLLQISLAGFYVFKKVPIKIKLKKPKFKALKSIIGFNAFLIFNQISEHLMYTSDKLILQKLLGSSSVTYYHISKRVHDFARKFNYLPISAIIPSLSAAFATNELQFIRKMNIQGTIIYNFIALPPLFALYIVFEDFINLWIGPGYEETILVGRLFLLTLIVGAPFKVFSHSLLSMGRVKEIGWIKFSYSIINIVVSYILTKQIGLIGVVIPTIFAWVFVFPLAFLYLMKQENFFKIKDFFKTSYSFYVALGIILIASIFNINSLFTINNWLEFIKYFLVYYLFFVIFIFLAIPNVFKLVIKELFLTSLKKLNISIITK